MEFEHELKKLNPEQLQAVNTIDGPVLVVAGPGSGKTQLLSMRVANILAKTHSGAGEILCLTFTDAACVNMRKRLLKIIGQEAYRVQIFTFHSFALEIINQYPDYFGFLSQAIPLDQLSQAQIIQEILEDLPIKNKLSTLNPNGEWFYFEDIKSRIGDLKKAGLSPQELKQVVETNQQKLEELNPIFADFFDVLKVNTIKKESILEILNLLKSQTDLTQNLYGFPTLSQVLLQDLQLVVSGELKLKDFRDRYFEKKKEKKQEKFVFKDLANSEKFQTLAYIYQKYQEKLETNGFLDFEDMLLALTHKIEQEINLQLNLQEKYQYILIDEFQDTNGVQMRLVKSLLNLEVTENQPNLLVVGDDDQAVYKFQGASLENILDFERQFKQVTAVVLTKNYRSTQEILDLAQDIIQNSKSRLPGINKKLVAMKN